MKTVISRTTATARPELRIVERGGVYKVFDKNDHFRCSFGTREAAQAYIDQRMGKRTAPAAQRAAEAMTS